ncbi:hypothetical protein Efla_002694 [Eimeria flavescens]
MKLAALVAAASFSLHHTAASAAAAAGGDAAAATVLPSALEVSSSSAAAAAVAAAAAAAAAAAEEEDELYPRSSCPYYPDETMGFQQAVPLKAFQQMLLRLPVESGSYRGLPLTRAGEGEEASAAVYIHRDIACALAQHEAFKAVFSAEGGSLPGVGLFTGAQEFAAFFAFVLHHTNYFTVFETESSLRECSPDPEAPCVEGASYKARGFLGIKGNKAYGAFSAFAFGDSSKLLQSPHLLGRQDVGAWVAALWQWTLRRPYGYECSGWPLGVGLASAHEALRGWASSVAAAEVSPVLEAAKETAASGAGGGEEETLAAAAAPFHGFGLALTLLLGEAACCPSAVGRLRSAAAAAASTSQRQQQISKHTHEEESAAAAADGGQGHLQSSDNEDQQEEELQQQQQGVLPPPNTPEEKAARFDAIMAGTAGPSLLQETPAAAAAADETPIFGATADSSGLTPLAAPRLLLPFNGVMRTDTAAAGGSQVSPLTAAALEGLFLSLLAFLLPPKPAAAAAAAAEDSAGLDSLPLPNPLAPQASLPLPGSPLCVAVPQQQLQEQQEQQQEEDEKRKPFSLFCVSLVRGCPALSPWASAAAAAAATAAEDTEDDRSRLEQETAGCRFSCYAAEDAPPAAAAAAAPLPAVAEAAEGGVLLANGSYLSKQGSGCLFACP